MKRGMSTPWGVAQRVMPLIDGVWFVSTASHGGMKLARERNRQVPDYMRQADGWYEEDCDWAIPFLVFEAEILVAGDAHAVKSITDHLHADTLKAWHPEMWERFFGVELQPGESWRKDVLAAAALIEAGTALIELTIDKAPGSRGGPIYRITDPKLGRAWCDARRKTFVEEADISWLKERGNRVIVDGVAA